MCAMSGAWPRSPSSAGRSDGARLDASALALLHAVTAHEEAARLAELAEGLAESIAQRAADPVTRERFEAHAQWFRRRAFDEMASAGTARTRFVRVCTARMRVDTCLRSVLWDVPDN